MASSVDRHPAAEKPVVPIDDENVLRKHVAFFDRNGDGLVYPWETYQGFRAIGCGILITVAGALVINSTLLSARGLALVDHLTYVSPFVFKTLSLRFMGVTLAYSTPKEGLCRRSLKRYLPSMLKQTQQPLQTTSCQKCSRPTEIPRTYRLPGRFAAFSEWKLLYRLCKDKNGLMQKETIKSFYDGDLFYKLEEERNSLKKKL